MPGPLDRLWFGRHLSRHRPKAAFASLDVAAGDLAGQHLGRRERDKEEGERERERERAREGGREGGREGRRDGGREGRGQKESGGGTEEGMQNGIEPHHNALCKQHTCCQRISRAHLR